MSVEEAVFLSTVDKAHTTLEAPFLNFTPWDYIDNMTLVHVLSASVNGTVLLHANFLCAGLIGNSTSTMHMVALDILKC